MKATSNEVGYFWVHNDMGDLRDTWYFMLRWKKKVKKEDAWNVAKMDAKIWDAEKRLDCKMIKRRNYLRLSSNFIAMDAKTGDITGSPRNPILS